MQLIVVRASWPGSPLTWARFQRSRCLCFALPLQIAQRRSTAEKKAAPESGLKFRDETPKKGNSAKEATRGAAMRYLIVRN